MSDERNPSSYAAFFLSDPTGSTAETLDYLSLDFHDDFEHVRLPGSLDTYKEHLFGLTTDPGRLKEIRQEQMPDSRYSSTRQVHFEVKEAEAMFRRPNIPFLNTPHSSVEEIATTVLERSGLRRRHQ